MFPNTYCSYVTTQKLFQGSWTPYKYMKYAVVSIFQTKSCRITAMDTHYTLNTFACIWTGSIINRIGAV